MNDMVSIADQLPADMSAFDMSGFDEMQEELAPGHPVVRFVKTKWIYQKDERLKLEMGQELVANPWKMQRGWLRFEKDGDGMKLGDQRLGFVADGFKPPAREELGHMDEDKWRKDSDGKPQDPWTQTIQFPAILIGSKGNYEVRIAGTSKSWNRCIGAFIGEWKAQMPSNAGKVPVVSLGSHEYRNEHGDQEAPTLTISRWVDPNEFKATVEEEEKPKEEKAQPKF